MTTVHILMECRGQYDDYAERPIYVFTNADEAHNIILAIQTIRAEYRGRHPDRRSGTILRAEWAKLGDFLPSLRDADCSFDLVECPIKEKS